MKYDLILLFLACSCTSTIDNKIFSGQGCKIWMELNIFGRGILCVDSNKHYRSYGVDYNGNVITHFPSYFLSVFDHGQWKTEQNYLYFKHDNNYINEHRVHSKNIFIDSIYLEYDERYLINVTDMFEVKNCDCKNLVAKLKKESEDRFWTLDSINEKKMNIKYQEYLDSKHGK